MFGKLNKIIMCKSDYLRLKSKLLIIRIGIR